MTSVRQNKKNNNKEKRIIPSKEVKNITICTNHFFEEDIFQDFQTSLLTWYDKNQRTLPWRSIAKTEGDANIRGYAVWVSEVMLQQTQVVTVIPYFNKWLKKWPSVQDLAIADVDEVLQEWAGLGYYSRGRRLHEGAKIIVNKLGGQIPQSISELEKSIPGIGAYSASAIASVAFQKVAGVVDGNVIRVLSRIQKIGAHVTAPGVRQHLWDLANKIVSKERPGDFNQALMELGAMICTPQNPDCNNCPMKSYCKAYLMSESGAKKQKLNFYKKKSKVTNNIIVDIEEGGSCDICLPKSAWKENPHVTAYPPKVEKKAARQEKINVLVIEKDNTFFMVKRPEKGLLAGLWEFPSILISEKDTETSIASFDQLLKGHSVPSLPLSSKKYIGEVVHLFSHIHTTYIVEHLLLKKNIDKKCSENGSTWMTDQEIKTAAVSTAMKKVLNMIKKGPETASKQPPSKKRKQNENGKQSSIKSFFN